MYIAGIDPGMSGGWAVLSCKEGYMPTLVAGGRMPTIKQGSKTLVNADELYGQLTKPLPGPGLDAVVLETVHAMPQQGVASTFTFGAAYGAAHAVGQLAAMRLEGVTPQTWKKYFGLSTDKRASLDRAAAAFGRDGLVSWTVLANDGIAEAALMALWFYETKIATGGKS
jgi:crossover junction endodeoxyribonuclease RuvC